MFGFGRVLAPDYEKGDLVEFIDPWSGKRELGTFQRPDGDGVSVLVVTGEDAGQVRFVKPAEPQPKDGE